MPAELSGMKGGDVILRMNQRVIRAFSDVIETVAVFGPQRRVICAVWREGKILLVPSESR